MVRIYDVAVRIPVGRYGGSGVGLSTGYAVNLFDACGNLVTGVTFGAAPSTSPRATFDNAADGSSVSTLSQVGTNGAFLSANGAEVGSPGLIGTATAGRYPGVPFGSALSVGIIGLICAGYVLDRRRRLRRTTLA